MRNARKVHWILGIALGAALASAGEVMVPEVTELRDAQKLVVSFVPASGEDAAAFLIRPPGGEEQRVTRPLPAEGAEHYQLALIAQTAKEGGITGFSLVTWKPGEKKAGAREWPELKEMSAEPTRIRGSQTFLLRPIPAPEAAAARPLPAWGFEVVSFRRIEPKEDDNAIVKAKKEVIEQGGVRLVEDRRFTILAPAAPREGTRYGILLVPVWKEAGKTLDGFDLKLVSTPAPAESQ